MAGIAHLHGLVRNWGKPTSGRYVYKTSKGWYWQCDLHDGDEAQPGEYADDYAATMQEAFADALAHAHACTPFWMTDHADRSTT